MGNWWKSSCVFKIFKIESIHDLSKNCLNSNRISLPRNQQCTIPIPCFPSKICTGNKFRWPEFSLKEWEMQQMDFNWTGSCLWPACVKSPSFPLCFAVWTADWPGSIGPYDLVDGHTPQPRNRRETSGYPGRLCFPHWYVRLEKRELKGAASS